MQKYSEHVEYVCNQDIRNIESMTSNMQEFSLESINPSTGTIGKKIQENTATYKYRTDQGIIQSIDGQ